MGSKSRMSGQSEGSCESTRGRNQVLSCLFNPAEERPEQNFSTETEAVD